MNITHEQYKEAILIVLGYVKQTKLHYDLIKSEVKLLPPFVLVNKNTLFCEAETSMRLYTLLKTYYNINSPLDSVSFSYLTVQEVLNSVSITKMMRLGGFGKKTFEELKELSYIVGITLNP